MRSHGSDCWFILFIRPKLRLHGAGLPASFDGRFMDDFLIGRRARVAAALQPGDAILLVGAGEPVPLPEGSDQTYPFRAHAEYFYLAGLECPGGVVAFDPRSGWESFVPAVTEGERVWEGRAQLPGTLITHLEVWLGARRGRPVAMLGAPVRGAGADEACTARARERLLHVRRPKDAPELALIRRAAAATAGGFAKLRGQVRPGSTERALQVELEAEFARGGGTRPGYGTIVGTGPNSAVLHFAPSDRAAQLGEFVLVDAGAEIDRYMADVIRSREHPSEVEGNAHLLMQSLGASLRRRTKIGSYGIDLLYKLGMLGTMVGFLLMLNSMGDLSSFDVDTLRGALQQMIGGMAVSLLTTIAGLIGGILLRLEYNIADALVTDISQTAVSFTEVSLLPLLARGERNV